MTEGFSAFHEKNLSVHDALLVLQRSLNRLRAQKYRRRPYELQAEALKEPEDPRSDHDALFDRDFWKKVAQLLERHMAEAIVSLSPRDQAILTGSYGLEDAGDPINTPSQPAFRSEAAAKKALTRARKRFSKHLESMIATDLELAKPFDRPLYEGILRLVRGRQASSVLTALQILRKRS